MKRCSLKTLQKCILKAQVPVYPDVDELQAWYRLFNRIIFDNALPKVTIEIITSKQAYAQCYFLGESDDEMVLRFNAKFNNYRLLLEVIVHEMIHVFQQHHEGKMSHGPTFFQWRGRVEAAHLGLKIKY